MLNISEVSSNGKIDTGKYKSFDQCGNSRSSRLFTRWLLVTSAIVFVFLLMPWSQNIQSKGTVTTLRPEHRPQVIPSAIDGRIERWFVAEGQLVNAGDTIVQISEIKTEYFDPELVDRTGLQVQAKEGSIASYGQKAAALEDQIRAYRSEWEYKQQQLKNKIEQSLFKIASDSIDLERAKMDYDIAVRQLNRTRELFDQGIKSRTDLEDKQVKAQETHAKLAGAENKLLISRNDLINSKLELSTAQFDFNQKLAKAESEKYSTLSARYEAEANVNKLRIEESNYQRRASFHFITAPQDCYITKALKTGIGETVKEGEGIVDIMPANYQLAVEIYIKPIDLPLVHQGQEVNFIFDGWPALVFSGWPGLSFGFFQGKVAAKDNTISENGKYRVLVSPDPDSRPWPEALRPGSGAEGIALLSDVPLWYELWRKLNGFPPDFYGKDNRELPKMKAPVKSIPK
ncbi:MAG: HlyD family efflux transporter periplasmic adaptor subunit [Saprospirales bacterium]|nr:HlyD family efflux transporter periplasmic adaptor subunit [Saprospirales bacterium]